ncbi:hypothetical protein FA95DRAFT_1613007 [Auriscalpium vulgare]|uniref:Uncharacterized protein n=1 Tax=Auriscalpium vulgare TaxID=40419 RepID=A0ACB8R4V6_9AGAM|nr:hypothetical protein FA95DRAFT_1613007 [Auriscalpium vulgare]
MPDRRKEDYRRHGDQRRNYQKAYNSVKRASRRKVSKERRLQHEHAKKLVRYYRLPPPYRSKIASISRDEDPLWTSHMRRREDEVWDMWTDHRKSLMATHCDDWLSRYVADIHAAINKHVAHVRELQNASTVSDLELHAHRRFIAGLHQEMEIIQHGTDVYEASLLEEVFIFSGRGVRKAYFRRAYGF